LSKQQLNPDFDSEEFLREHWQKKPVLLPKLIQNLSDPLSPEELAGLACEELVESRLIREPQHHQWELSHGPFVESDFTQLPDDNWTLLVQAVDQWVGDVGDIKTLFKFLPSWRIDDVMVSFAAPGGSVGPHYDYYDVFLLQGLGERNWKIGELCSADSALVPDSQLSLLQSFKAVEEYTLSAGDALYVPPRFSHWGTANTDSLCYSIGFRAPSVAEMIEGFSDFIIKDQDPGQRYEDGELLNRDHSSEIELASLNASFEQLTNRFAAKEKFAAWFGCYVTQPKYPELVEALDSQLSPNEFAALLSEGVRLLKNPSSRFAYIDSAAQEQILLFVDGAMINFPRSQSNCIVELSEVTQAIPGTSDEILGNPSLAELLRQLLNQGSLLASD